MGGKERLGDVGEERVGKREGRVGKSVGVGGSVRKRSRGERIMVGKVGGGGGVLVLISPP